MVRLNLTLRSGLIALCTVGSILHSTANNIQATNGTLTGDNGTQISVQFDLSWENSWRIAPDRWDAAWVFVKFRGPDGLWRHCSLDNTGHVAPGGSTIAPGLVDPASAFDASTNPVVGAFIHRTADGSGTFTANGVQLRWNYSVDNIAAIDVQEVRVFAIEMVHVPQGAFAAGDGAPISGTFTLTTINTANASITPSGTGSLGGQGGGRPTGQTAPNSAGWPNGYSSFYCMKYELTVQQYTDFLNTLTRTQQNTRTETNLAAGITSVTNRYVMSGTNVPQVRNGIRCDATIDGADPITFYCDLNQNGAGGESSDGQCIACNYMNWGDLTAYLDWSGLRPMTELEFEKACRGTVAPVANEFAWGTNSVNQNAYTITNNGAANEDIASNYSTTEGNAIWGTMGGPFRVGIFAGNSSNTGRVSAGASYYGIMELSGSLFERMVTIANADGRSFSGTHGNGGLDTDGSANASTWPAPTTGNGSCNRGGALLFSSTFMRVSHRDSSPTSDTDRWFGYGGRGVRSAP